MANNNHHNRNGRFYNSRSHHRDNREIKEGYEERESKDRREHKENREHKESRSNRDSQVINSFILGTKELEDKNAEFQYDKGWYSIVDIIGEEKTVIYKSKNAQEAYTKWNVYIGRKKERAPKAEKAE